ncbi:MAG: DUF4965 domain-containing protein [Phycisphaerae bacterium]|nr:DUF4965 domain-containing protein [Phycisphaerae bacterium]
MTLAILVGAATVLAVEPGARFRPPATPLVTVDPYMSAWSFSDRLTDEWPRHWTGAVHAMAGMVRVDGKTWRFMGPDAVGGAAADQIDRTVRPTQTLYAFHAGPIELRVTFTTPLLPDDLDLLSCPVTYVTFDVCSRDGKAHDVRLYFDATAEWAVNEAKQEVTWDRMPETPAGMSLLRFGSKDQPVLGSAGDNRRIDWGYFYVGVPDMPGSRAAITSHTLGREGFVSGGTLPKSDDNRKPRAARDDWPVIACCLGLGSVGETMVSRHLLLAYDDVVSIMYMNNRLRGWWTRQRSTFQEMLSARAQEYQAVRKRCDAFDTELLADAVKVGGRAYADLVALAYRQTLAGGKLVVGLDKTPWFFTKECFSNGCIATVDVAYPASPFFALLSPTMLRGMLTPVFEYARSDAWPHPFAPHDLGTYPLANGQVYGRNRGVRNQMPVEECGNMILMTAAVAKAEGNAEYAKRHWYLLVKWANYLAAKGLDPEDQLCTDDFAGHLAHNANLSLKAINALGAFGMLCEMLRDKTAADRYKQLAKDMAGRWRTMAADGDHYRLAFDKPGTWSQKYNLVWDRLLDLDLFDKRVAREEIAFYLTHMNRYGLPLDNRKDYTKADWVVWTATLAESRTDFEKLLAPMHRFFNETPDRVPMTDWYDTKTAKAIHFRARPVIGGIFIKLLSDAEIWRKWSRRARPSNPQ